MRRGRGSRLAAAAEPVSGGAKGLRLCVLLPHLHSVHTEGQVSWALRVCVQPSVLPQARLSVDDYGLSRGVL